MTSTIRHTANHPAPHATKTTSLGSTTPSPTPFVTLQQHPKTSVAVVREPVQCRADKQLRVRVSMALAVSEVATTSGEPRPDWVQQRLKRRRDVQGPAVRAECECKCKRAAESFGHVFLVPVLCACTIVDSC